MHASSALKVSQFANNSRFVIYLESIDRQLLLGSRLDQARTLSTAAHEVIVGNSTKGRYHQVFETAGGRRLSFSLQTSLCVSVAECFPGGWRGEVSPTQSNFWSLWLTRVNTLHPLERLMMGLRNLWFPSISMAYRA